MAENGGKLHVLRRLTTSRFAMAVMAAVMGATTAVTVAGASGEPTVINACVSNKTGAVRIIPSGSCKTGEYPISWNQQGVQGEQGSPGESGAAEELTCRDRSGRVGQVDPDWYYPQSGMWPHQGVDYTFAWGSMKCRFPDMDEGTACDDGYVVTHPDAITGSNICTGPISQGRVEAVAGFGPVTGVSSVRIATNTGDLDCTFTHDPSSTFEAIVRTGTCSATFPLGSVVHVTAEVTEGAATISGWNVWNYPVWNENGLCSGQPIGDCTFTVSETDFDLTASAHLQEPPAE